MKRTMLKEERELRELLQDLHYKLYYRNVKPAYALVTAYGRAVELHTRERMVREHEASKETKWIDNRDVSG